MDKMYLEKSDLHIHLDEAPDKDYEKVVNILKRAEEQNVKNLSFVKFNRIDHFGKESQLYKLFKSGELQKHYAGKIITGVEMSCKINDAQVSDSGFNFNSYITHVLIYDYDPNLISKNKWFNKDYLIKLWSMDLEELLEKAKALGLSVPTLDYFNYDDGHYSIKLYDYIYAHKDTNPVNAQFVKDYPNKSSMQRIAVETPGNILFYKPRIYPTYKEVCEIAKECGGKLVLAHPAKMNILFDTMDYINAMLNIVPNSFWGLEGQYMLNSKAETQMIKNYANKLNLEITGGSDFRYYINEGNPEGKMYFFEKDEKILYVPQPSFLIKESVDGEKYPYIMLEKDVIEQLKDFREYYKK